MRYLLILFLSLNIFASTLHLATSAKPSRLNPVLATDSSSSEITGFLFNGLVKYDKDLSTIIGDLA
ncbi:MAG: peptide ABC transporter substrate-binding protein, partial [Sulfurimonas sp.]